MPSLRHVLLLATSSAVVGGSAAAQQSPQTPSVGELGRAVVTVLVATPDSEKQGSGVILDSAGMIVTAAHVIAGGITAQVRMPSGEMYPVEGVLDVDPKLDVALLRVAGFGLPSARLGNSDSLIVGQRLLAIGSPLGLEATVSDGLLSGVRLANGVRLLQISVPVSPGSSGGPIFTLQGAVIGIVVSGFVADHAQNLNFALPINYVRGRLALARSKTLTAFAVAAASARPSGASSTASSPTGIAQPARVNDTMHLDPMILGGVEIRVEQTDASGGQHHVLISYRAGHSPTGDPQLERVSEDRVQIKRGFRHFDAFTDHIRSVYDAGASPRLTELGDRTAVLAGVTPESYSLTLAGGLYTLVYNGVNRTGVAPVGSLSSLFQAPFLAALPDSLPAEEYIWAFNLVSGAVMPSHFEFGPTDSLDVPVAVTASGCSEGAETRSVRLRVVWVRVSEGSGERRYPILADRPHVDVDPTNVKCIKFPDQGTRATTSP